MIKNTAQKGFSIVELLIVILVAGIIITVLANITPTINLLNNSSRENLARQIAAKKIEDIRASGFDNLANGINQFSDPRLTGLPQSAATVTIDDCPISICTNSEQVKQVTIDISWVYNGKGQDFRISTLVSKGGLR